MKKLPPVEVVQISDLAPYDRNTNYHPQTQIDELAENIKEMGFLVPLVIGKNNVIAAGHGRLEAAKQLGMTSVNCVRADHLTAKQRRAFAIFDNKISRKSEIDTDLLKLELGDLHTLGVDIMKLGYSADELRKYLPDIVPPDLEDIVNPNLSTNFIVTCESIAQLNELMQKLELTKSKVSYDEFLECVSENLNT